MKKQITPKPGQKMIWDNGYGYYIVEYIGMSTSNGYLNCKFLSGVNEGKTISIAATELEIYSKEQESYLKLKYDFLS